MCELVFNFPLFLCDVKIVLRNKTDQMKMGNEGYRKRSLHNSHIPGKKNEYANRKAHDRSFRTYSHFNSNSNRKRGEMPSFEHIRERCIVFPQTCYGILFLYAF